MGGERGSGTRIASSLPRTPERRAATGASSCVHGPLLGGPSGYPGGAQALDDRHEPPPLHDLVDDLNTSISETALAKVLQQLVRAGASIGSRGVGGGYRLARSPHELTVLDIIEAFEPPREPQQCLLDDEPGECHDHTNCRLRRLFDEVDEMARATFASTSLSTLVAAPVVELPTPAESHRRP